MNHIAYYRVSTKKQGESTLGLKAQQESVRRFLNGKSILHEFTEVETGTNKRHRPILAEAIELCKKHDATLIIAKLDRLARNVGFVSSLMDANVKFVAVDMPQANELTIHIMSAIAQHEAKIISTRIKEALAQSTKKLGTSKNLTQEAKQLGRNKIRERHTNNENNIRSTAFIKGMDFENMRLTEIARLLNENKFSAAMGKKFSACQVKRLVVKINQNGACCDGGFLAQTFVRKTELYIE